jgi:2-aminoethylphosphonate-pyruvate transaminase
VYVEANGGRLTGLSKQRATLKGDVVGELVGLTRISTRCLEVMCAHAETVFRESKHLEYEQALVAAGRDVKIECPVVPDLVWSEIDDEHHLARARDEIYPRIMEREAAYAA